MRPDVEPVTIASVRFHQGRPIVGFDGVETMDDAEALVGAELKVPESELPPLPGGTYYRHDLVGCEVTDTDGQAIGRVTVRGRAAGAEPAGDSPGRAGSDGPDGRRDLRQRRSGGEADRRRSARGVAGLASRMRSTS
jgi:hypothetical protein